MVENLLGKMFHFKTDWVWRDWMTGSVAKTKGSMSHSARCSIKSRGWEE